MTCNEDQIDHSGSVRRIDLRLRAKYPTLRTRIFKIDFRNYCIFIENEGLDFEILREDFHQRIRYMTTPVVLTSSMPEDYVVELPSISDDRIPTAFEGLHLTSFDIANLIESKYPDVSVASVETVRPLIVAVRLNSEVDSKTKEAISLTLKDIRLPAHFIIEDGGEDTSVVAPSNPVSYIPSARSLSHLDLPFLKRDEELWFEHLNAIYAGDFQKKDLFFFDVADTACFIDFSVFDNINLRNHLLLYDVVFCALPPREQMAKFLANQKITRDEIVSLASRGRLKIISIQPEKKLDSKLLRDVYEARESAVISRRAVAALCAIDIVSINQSYLFNHPDLYPVTLPLAEALSELGRDGISNVLNFIMWPKNALRSSFEDLQQASSKAVSNFGVNNLILQAVPDELADRYEFEFTMCAESIHVAHALDATYFPTKDDASGFTDLPYALMMGNALNFFKSATGGTVDELLKIEEDKAVGTPLIDPISVFEINEYVPITEFERETSSRVLRKSMRSLFTELSALSESERKARVARYNKQVESRLDRRLYGEGAIELGIDSIGLPFLSSAKWLATFLFEEAKNRIPIARQLVEKIAEIKYSQVSEKTHISLLSKLNRVARLRKGYQ